MASPNGYEGYNTQQMVKLLRTAEEFCEYEEMVPCNQIYRNKERAYFKNIFKNKRGIMEPIMKDNGGDPRNPINGKLEGVFFTASVKRGSRNGKPLDISPYGSSRFQIPPEILFNYRDYNLYFSDFYCCGTKYHYIILVVTKINTKGDAFCCRRLPLLDWDCNNFLTCDGWDYFEVTDTNFCIIEVFYTSEVNIKKALDWGDAEILHGLNTCSRSQEVYKDLNCSVCNAFSPQHNQIRQRQLLAQWGYSMLEMKILLKEAENYCDGEMVPCYWLYRNKSKEYFNEIIHNNSGIMEATMKDLNGDPRNPINNKLEGLFFTASVSRRSQNGKPKAKSPYGSYRLQIDISYLIDPDECNIYFADFYCTGSDCHYVTLVVANCDSEADRFCCNNLPLLKWDNNEFLTYDEGLFEVTDSDFCIVQVFYCDDVDINEILRIRKAEYHRNIPLCKRSLNTSKDLNCHTCNPFQIRKHF